ncbi:MAG: qdoI [Chthoniobacteraceae bacterium]|nr:qdoI [Chthoniobacteraceae bacterium]
MLLASGEQTGGAYTLFEALVPPGGGPPPHIHTREEESFYILEGEMTFRVADRSLTAGRGAFVQIPRGTVHAFKNASPAPVRMLIQCAPAGFEKFLAEFASELPSPDSPPLPPCAEEIGKLLAAAPKYGIQIVQQPAGH